MSEKDIEVVEVVMLENNVENNVSTIPGLNGGTLRNGGTIGNKGGTGRPKSEVRAAAAAGFDAALPILLKMATEPGEPGNVISQTERLKAIDLLGKYGGLQQVDNTSGDKPMQQPVAFGSMSIEERKELLANLPKST